MNNASRQMLRVDTLMIPANIFRSMPMSEKIAVVKAMFNDGLSVSSAGKIVLHTDLMYNSQMQPESLVIEPSTNNPSDEPDPYESEEEPEINYDDDHLPPTLRVPTRALLDGTP